MAKDKIEKKAVEVVEESDVLRAQLAASSVENARIRLAMAERDQAAVQGQLREKYKLVGSDGIDVATRQIIRKPAAPAKT